MATDDNVSPSDGAPPTTEQLDPSKLGEEPGDPGRAADQDYPPERPLGVDDPALDPAEGDVAPDDVARRAWREQPEQDEGRS